MESGGIGGIGGSGGKAPWNLEASVELAEPEALAQLPWHCDAAWWNGVRRRRRNFSAAVESVYKLNGKTVKNGAVELGHTEFFEIFLFFNFSASLFSAGLNQATETIAIAITIKVINF